MTGLEVVFCALLFLVLAPLASLVGVIVCGKFTYYLLSKICKDDITKALDAIIKHVLDKMDQKEVASMREALKDVIVNKDNK